METTDGCVVYGSINSAISMKKKGLDMKSLKLMCGVVVVVSVMLVAAPALSGDGAGDGRGRGVCRTDGSWIGVSPAWGMQWTAVFTSESHWKGSYSTRWIGGDPTLDGNFTSVVAFSNTVGTWIRTGRRTFQYTMITYGVDALGQPVYIAKNSGYSETSGDCDYQEMFDSAISLYHPSQDPFGEDPPAFGCILDPSVHSATRMQVDPPCEP